MAHVVKDDLVLVDWTTGDPEGDRARLFQAYRDFLKAVRKACDGEHSDEAAETVLSLFEKWKVTDLNVDDFPRISIERPVS